MQKSEQTIPTLEVKTLPLPKSVNGANIIKIITGVECEKRVESIMDRYVVGFNKSAPELDIVVSYTGLRKDNTLEGAFIYIKIKPEVEYEIFGALLIHPLLLNLREEEYYLGGYMLLNFENYYEELRFVENMPHRKMYQLSFLPKFMNLYNTLCQSIRED